jgi:hypothetical protein
VSVSAFALAGEDQTAYVVTTDNRLLAFDVDAPETLLFQYDVTGLQNDEMVVGIDIRPANGELNALSSASRLYTIDPSSGEASAVGEPFTPALDGTSFGFDFNPTVDRIRVVSNTGQNLRLNPDTGAVGTNPDTGAPTIDGDLAYADDDANAGRQPAAVGAGYTNSVADATSTELYVIDARQAVLALQDPPNDGILNTVGDLGMTPTNMVGFDIAPSGEAYAVISGDSGMLPDTGIEHFSINVALMAAFGMLIVAFGLRTALAVHARRA